jgi:hypothetical protein
MKTSSLFGLFLVLTAVSCRYPNQFDNTPRNAPHALLRGGHGVFAIHINRQPTSFWRTSDDFRIPVGTNEVKAAYSGFTETVSYEPQMFVAAAGSEYALSRKREPDLVSPFSALAHPTTSNAWVIHDRRDRVIIEQRGTSGPVRVVAEASSEDYIFGVSSREAAIASYRRQKP